LHAVQDSGQILELGVVGHDLLCQLGAPVGVVGHHQSAQELLVVGFGVPVSIGTKPTAPAFDLLNLPRPRSAAPWAYVKIEGRRPATVAALVEAEIPVMAHLGLTPQSIHKLGGFRVQGRGDGPRRELMDAALELEAAGAFSMVLECVPADLASEVTAAVEIPTIGIGAGPDCDGQVLVFHDLLGLEDRLSPRFVRRYAELGSAARQALSTFAIDVREGNFPSAEESYDDPTLPSAEPIRKIYG